MEWCASSLFVSFTPFFQGYLRTRFRVPTLELSRPNSPTFTPFRSAWISPPPYPSDDVLLRERERYANRVLPPSFFPFSSSFPYSFSHSENAMLTLPPPLPHIDRQSPRIPPAHAKSHLPRPSLEPRLRAGKGKTLVPCVGGPERGRPTLRISSELRGGGIEESGNPGETSSSNSVAMTIG